MDVIDAFTVERAGTKYRVKLVFDPSTTPWEDIDLLGAVSDWTHDAKEPGQRVLCRDRNAARYYDFRAAVRKARAEFPTVEMAIKAVEHEFKWIKDWCDNRWCYVGVCVFPLTARGDELRSYTESIWGVESEDETYIHELADDLADRCAFEVAATTLNPAS